MNVLLLASSQMQGTQAVITDAQQLQHLQQVLAIKVGDTLKIGELGGLLGRARVAQIDTDAQGRLTSVQLDELCLETLPPAKLQVTVLLALPRPKVLRRLIMDMTALGVARIVLVNSYRSQKSYWQSPMLKRLDEFVHEGLQQGVDSIPPQILLRPRFKPFVEDELRDMLGSGGMMVAHPYGLQSFATYRKQQGLPTVLCIGSEGGWIDYEVKLLEAQGGQSVSLGRRILRTEAAVNALLGQWL